MQVLCKSSFKASHAGTLHRNRFIIASGCAGLHRYRAPSAQPQNPKVRRSRGRPRENLGPVTPGGLRIALDDPCQRCLTRWARLSQHTDRACAQRNTAKSHTKIWQAELLVREAPKYDQIAGRLLFYTSMSELSMREVLKMPGGHSEQIFSTSAPACAIKGTSSRMVMSIKQKQYLQSRRR